MKIYFDESGQTGCVLKNKNGDLYNKEQRFFILAGVLCKDDNTEYILRRKYQDFLDFFNISAGEFKGTDILTRENNDKLEYFIDNLLDNEHFYLCCYDKIFYLATILSTYFLGRDTMKSNPLMYYKYASALTREKDILFKKFCESIEENTADSRKKFVEYFANYPFEEIDEPLNVYLMSAKAMLKVYGESDVFPEFPLPLGSYLNSEITHLINLNALGESLLAIKVQNNLDDYEIEVIHDKILEFEKEFFDTLGTFHPEISLEFKDSKSDLLIQYADNIASIFRKAFTETTRIFINNEPWKEESQWFPTLLASIMKRLSCVNVKFVTTISDWVLPLCVEQIFDSKSVISKDQETFMSMFLYYRKLIEETIKDTDFNISL